MMDAQHCALYSVYAPTFMSTLCESKTQYKACVILTCLLSVVVTEISFTKVA